MIAVATTGKIGADISKILIEMESQKDLMFTGVTEANFLIVGKNSDDNIFAKVIFDKSPDRALIYPDTQFDSYLRDYYPAYYL